jgi:hypothetical protein
VPFAQNIRVYIHFGIPFEPLPVYNASYAAEGTGTLQRITSTSFP